ncbi:MAG TPA: hypothetical protein VIA45_01280 [Thermoanaerobaculia bacterium]
MKWLLVGAGIGLLAFGLDRILLWLEWRGWIDYRGTSPGRINPGQVGPAFLAIESLFQFGARHALEERQAVRTEREATGDGVLP